MAKGAVVISWKRPLPGREAKALETFAAGGELAQRRVKDGEVDRTAVFISANRPNGFRIYEGDVERLMALTSDEEFRRLMVRANTCVDDLRIEYFRGGDDDTVAEEIGTWMQELSELGYL